MVLRTVVLEFVSGDDTPDDSSLLHALEGGLTAHGYSVTRIALDAERGTQRTPRVATAQHGPVIRIKTVEGETRQHAFAASGSDYTLCGLTTDGDAAVVRWQKEKMGAITCEQCLTVIRYCRTIGG